MAQRHPTEADLMMAADGELPESRQKEVEAHLRACWQCRARRTRFERSIEEFADWHGSLPVEGGEGPRALLRARMAELERGAPRETGRPARFAMAGIAAAAAVVAGILVWGGSTSLTAATPDPAHTPGLTLPVTAREVCAQAAIEEDRPVSPQLARKVFLAYGIRNPKPRRYEVDYLITPALGGAEDVRNMWPQPYSAGVWNSHVKDALEDHLRHLVCSGRLRLADAQRELADDWVAAYQRHFRTSRPLAEHALFVKDRPWE